MSNNWRKYATSDDNADGKEEQDPRKVLDEEFDFLAKNWHWYLVAAAFGFSTAFAVVAVFLVIVGAIVNG